MKYFINVLVILCKKCYMIIVPPFLVLRPISHNNLAPCFGNFGIQMLVEKHNSLAAKIVPHSRFIVVWDVYDGVHTNGIFWVALVKLLT
jgi:hypothetical protein